MGRREDDMKSFGRIVALALAVLLLLCVLGGFALGLTEKGRGILHFSTDVFKLTRTAKGAEGLASKYPFTPPGDGTVSEERLLVYIAICEQVAPSVREYEAWMKAHEGEQGDFKEAQEAINLTVKVLEGASGALDRNKMGPVEFNWIGRALEEAAREEASGGTPLEREMLESYSKVLDFPGLSAAEREQVTKEAARFRDQMGTAPGEAASANAKLYRKHAAELKACDLGAEGRQLLQGLAQGKHSHRRKAEAEDASKGD
jgi:hypothetical protein